MIDYTIYTVKEIKEKLNNALKRLKEYKDEDKIIASENLAELQEYGDVLLVWNTKVGETYIDLCYLDIKKGESK